jgi:hypothetical protein
MKVDPAAASLRGQHTEQNTTTEYMIFEFTAYTATSFEAGPQGGIRKALATDLRSSNTWRIELVSWGSRASQQTVKEHLVDSM